MAFKRKAAKQDYSAAMLPHNRKEVFFDVIKLNWKAFISYGLIMLIFTFPSLCLSMAEDVITMNLMQGYDALPPQEQAGILAQIFTVKNTRAILDIISYLVLSVGVAGIVRVIRQYAWGENAVLSHDFKIGIKQNTKQMLVIGTLCGIVNIISVFAYNMSAVTADWSVAIIAVLSADILIILSVPVLAYSAVSICLYEKRLHKHLLTSLAVTAKAPFKTLLAIICCSIPFSLQLIPISYFHIFGKIISSILIPFVLLGWMLFAFNRFDEFINKKNHPELVGKGTFPMETDEAHGSESKIENID